MEEYLHDLSKIQINFSDMFSKTIIISPSGKFYGSEQTLFSFMQATRNIYTVYISSNDGRFLKAAKEQKKHQIKSFSNVKLLYVIVFFKMLFGNSNCLYVNEGGHIRYIKKIASILKNKLFVVHVRLIEDTTHCRLKNTPSNVKLISTSKYISDLIQQSTGILSEVISSPCRCSDEKPVWNSDFLEDGLIHVGIIGRVTPTKGLSDIINFCEYIEMNKMKIYFHFWGDVESSLLLDKFKKNIDNYKFVKIVFHNYEKDKKVIFNRMDIIIHFCKTEPLGGIFFESLNFGKPFIGFNARGIGEIAKKLQISNLMVDDSINWEEEMLKKIKYVQCHIEEYKEARNKMLQIYSLEDYCRKIEEILL